MKNVWEDFYIKAENSKSFGRHVWHARRAKGLSRRELAKLIGIDFVLLSKIENDRIEASERIINQLVEHLGLVADFIMTNPITARSSSETCRYYLDQLGWDWKHPRISDWLIRVQQHYSESLWAYGEPVPEFVKASLAQRLKYYFKCQHFLNALGWNWSHPTVLSVYEHFGCKDKLSLEGYKTLLDELMQEVDLIHF